jgi:hypothetical protein
MTRKRKRRYLQNQEEGRIVVKVFRREALLKDGERSGVIIPFIQFSFSSKRKNRKQIILLFHSTDLLSLFHLLLPSNPHLFRFDYRLAIEEQLKE